MSKVQGKAQPFRTAGGVAAGRSKVQFRGLTPAAWGRFERDIGLRVFGQMNNAGQQGSDLAGQVIVITGGGRGLGREFARALSRGGASIALIARSEAELSETVAELSAAGGTAISFAADVSDFTAAGAIVDRVERQLGPVDLLINNAGVATALGPVSETEPRDWWRCFEVNLLGPYLYTRAVLPGMIA